MKERTIMIFPKFDNMAFIDTVRDQYDPLAKLVRPHLTLVFPFSSDLTTEMILQEITNQINGYPCFQLICQGIVKDSNAYGNYLFLLVQEGNEHLIELHDRLYSGIFSTYRADIPYVPHLTIGKLQSEEALDSAYQTLTGWNHSFTTMVDTISVEIIGEQKESIIELEYSLSQ